MGAQAMPDEVRHFLRALLWASAHGSLQQSCRAAVPGKACTWPCAQADTIQYLLACHVSITVGQAQQSQSMLSRLMTGSPERQPCSLW